MPLPTYADKEKLAEVALAILWLGAHDDRGMTRVWKQMDWDLTDLLYEKGWITDPKTKAKSVLLTDDGEKLADTFLRQHFSIGN